MKGYDTISTTLDDDGSYLNPVCVLNERYVRYERDVPKISPLKKKEVIT